MPVTPIPTTAAWLNKTFMFAGPDGRGVRAVVKDYTNTKKCNYKYDRLIGHQADRFRRESLCAAAQRCSGDGGQDVKRTGGAGRYGRCGSVCRR